VIFSAPPYSARHGGVRQGYGWPRPLRGSRLSHRVTGSTGSERPAPVPVPGTGRYRPVSSFVLMPHTDWPTGPGRLLLEFGQPAPNRSKSGLRGRLAGRAEVATGWSMVPRWQAGMRAWAVPVARFWSRICTYLYIDSGKKKVSEFVFTLRFQRAPPGIAHYRVRGTRYRLSGTGSGTGATT
jgi:hypothetical protein